MSFKEAITELESAQVLRARVLPPTARMAKAAAAVAARMTHLAEPSGFDTDELRAKLERVAVTGDWARISERDLRYTCFCIFRGNPPLVTNIRFLSGYLGALRSLSSRLATKYLMRAYFTHFNPSAPGIREIARYLSEVVTTWNWDWAKHQRNYLIFNPDEAARRLAEAAIPGGNPRQFLAEMGFRGQLAGCELNAACFRIAARAIGRQLEQSPKVDIARILTSWAKQEDGRLTFYGERNALAKALLLPWEARDPPEDLLDHLTQFFLETYKDPRIVPLAWAGVDEEVKIIMLRWLAKGSLEQFLRVVDQTAPGHQWDFRRAFWTAYVDGGYVRDAWVVFGITGQEYAKRLARERQDSNMSRFGRLNRPYTGNQAVLLLRIGDLVIGDWSHNGALRIWRQESQSVPIFYQRDYDASDLRKGSDFSRVHSHPPGGWQADVERFIRQHTRIRVDERNYMPKGRRH